MGAPHEPGRTRHPQTDGLRGDPELEGHLGALHRRAVPLSVAASTLNATVAVVQRLVVDGVLVADDRAHDGRRMVTRDSLASAASARGSGKQRLRGPRDGLIRWDEARASLPACPTPRLTR